MGTATTWTEGRIRAIRPVTPTIRLFEIVPESGAPQPFAPGAHIEVGVLVEGRAESRCFSLVGEARPDCYRIAVKLRQDGRGGTAYLWTLAEGARIGIGTPVSAFTVPFGRAAYLLVAGGVGITPLLGMASTLARRGEPVRFLHAARSADELAFRDELAALLGDGYESFVSEDGQRANLAGAIAALPAGGVAAVCGPLPMLEEARRLWAAAGRPPEDLRWETFGSSGRLAAESFQVRVAGRDIEVTVPRNRSLLDALADAGVELIADCRRGECGLCAVDVVEIDGEIDHRDVFFSDMQKRSNHRLCACVSRAVGRLTIDTGYRADSGHRAGHPA